MTNEEIIKLIKSGKDINSNLMRLYNQNTGFINMLVNKYVSFGEKEDLLQEAYIILDDAVKSYDSSKGALFMTHYIWVFKQHMRDFIINNQKIHISENMRWNLYRLGKLRTAYYEKNKELTDNDIIRELDISKKTLSELKKLELICNVKSIDEEIDNSEGDCFTLLETIPCAESYIDECIDSLYQEQLGRDIKEALNDIGDKEADVVKEHFFNGIEYKAIAKRLDVPPQHIHKMAQKALRDLRNGRYRTRLKGYYDEISVQYARAYNCGIGSYMHYGSKTEDCAIKIIEVKEETDVYNSVTDAVQLKSLIKTYEKLKLDRPELNRTGNLDKMIRQANEQIRKLTNGSRVIAM